MQITVFKILEMVIWTSSTWKYNVNKTSITMLDSIFYLKKSKENNEVYSNIVTLLKNVVWFSGVFKYPVEALNVECLLLFF